MKWLLICAAAVTVLFSCNDKQKEQQGKVLDEKKMQAVLWDVMQAEAFTENFIKRDSSKKDTIENAALQKKIFELHKVTKEDFYASYSYYSSQPATMKRLLDSVTTKAEKERNNMMIERYGGNKKPVEE